MKKILAFAGSNSQNSINHALLVYLVSKIAGHETTLIKLTDFVLPIYGIDHEQERGFPIDLQLLKNKIVGTEALIIAVNEHNGTVSAFFKNVLDWLSRADRNFLAEKKILLVSASPGARGGAGALAYAKAILPRFGAQVVESFSVPNFQQNFDLADGKIINEQLELGIHEVLATFEQELSEG